MPLFPQRSSCSRAIPPLEARCHDVDTTAIKPTGSCLVATKRDDLDVRAIGKMLDEARDEPPNAGESADEHPRVDHNAKWTGHQFVGLLAAQQSVCPRHRHGGTRDRPIARRVTNRRNRHAPGTRA